ncbi:MAG TPA: zinc ribbon domain-containing protein [Steroidobacteraceae bacterium]|nr:zinc ribbon domain-containing protein [Steroidobacteraceae bacterium]HRX88205.1 zinc ribbon domain-containing protein [Steroidobacteraceae bacterium]
MPFYEYQCTQCEHHLEVLQKITDKPLRKCPACGKSALKKLMSAPVFRLKGSGWYETDFKSDSEAKRNLVGADADDVKLADSSGTDKADGSKDESAKTTPDKADAAKPDKAVAHGGDGGQKTPNKVSADKPGARKSSGNGKAAATYAATKKSPAAGKPRAAAPRKSQSSAKRAR